MLHARRCCDGGKGVVKSNRYTREEIAAALLSFGEICGNSRGRPQGIKFYRKFYCVPSMPLYGANFLSGGGGGDRDKRDGAEKDGEVFRGHGFNAADTKA